MSCAKKRIFNNKKVQSRKHMEIEGNIKLRASGNHCVLVYELSFGLQHKMDRSISDIGWGLVLCAPLE